MLLLEWYNLNLPLLLSQKDDEGLAVHDYCERFSATQVKDRLAELTYNCFPTRVIVFNPNSREKSPLKKYKYWLQLNIAT